MNYTYRAANPVWGHDQVEWGLQPSRWLFVAHPSPLTALRIDTLQELEKFTTPVARLSALNRYASDHRDRIRHQCQS